MQWLLTKPENAFIYNNCSLFNEAQIKLFGTCKKYGVIVIDKQACLTLSLSLSLSLSFSLSNTHFLSPFLFWMTDRSWSTYQLKVNAKKIYLIMHLCTTHFVFFRTLEIRLKMAWLPLKINWISPLKNGLAYVLSLWILQKLSKH